jgi:hypothetical protein
MRSFPLYVLGLWGCSALVQLIVLILLFSKGNFRKLPVFTVYTALNISQVVFLLIVYQVYGVYSATAGTLAWASECVTLLAQALATTEILGITLKPYRGIWGLGWRALVLTSAIVIVLAVWATRTSWALAKWFELERGYHLTFATALVVFLMLVRYYSIPVATPYKIILSGFCFYSCMEVLVNTFFQAVFSSSFPRHQSLRQFSMMSSFIVALLLWAVALRKPLPAVNAQVASNSDLSYQSLSPEINEQLRALNEKLARLWKLEARPN